MLVINPNARAGNSAIRRLKARPIHPDCLLVAGGDGTLHHLVNRSTVTRPLGVVPVGTANDLAVANGIPRSIGAALAYLGRARPYPMDVVQVNEVKTLTSVGIGLPARVLQRAERLKRLRFMGRWVYLVSVGWELLARPLPRHRFVINEEEWTAHTILIMNQPVVGSCFRLAPEAKNDDGWVDMILFAQRSRWHTLLSLCTGKGLIRRRLSRASIEADSPVPFVADGELYAPCRRFEVEVLPQAIHIMRASDD